VRLALTDQIAEVVAGEAHLSARTEARERDGGAARVGGAQNNAP